MSDMTVTISDETPSAGGPRVLTGRRRIVSSAPSITADNVREQFELAMATHAANFSDINYLHEYFLGRQPVLGRVKEVRPEIKNTVVENRAYQICKDRADSLAGEPITFSAHVAKDKGRPDDEDEASKASDELSHRIQRLNDVCEMSDKHAVDMEIVQWMCEVGVGYRLVMPSTEIAGECDTPIMMASLDPRRTFVVYSNDMFRRPLYAATYVTREDTSERVVTLYTAESVFQFADSGEVHVSPNPMGRVPIIEYDANSERMGVFEAVLSLLDAINEVESNRVDGIAQFVQALLVLENVDFEDDDAETGFKKLMKMGCLQIHSTEDNKASVTMLTSELNQDQTQTLVDALYKTALSICGMPFNVGGSASTSDTGAAVTMRDGWSNHESRCKETEIHFKRGEREFLAIACYLLEASEHLGLRPVDVEIKFTRRNYEAIQSKAQVLTTLLGCGKVHPRLAFEYCGMFPDPETAYDLSKAYAAEAMAGQMQLLKAKTAALGGSDTRADGPNGVGGDVTAASKGTQPPSTKRSEGKDEQNEA